LLQGVRIPTLGSFEVIPQQVQVGKEVLTIPKPTFRLARNLVDVHDLPDDKDLLPGNKELEPLKYFKAASAVAVSRRKVEICVEGTTSLLWQCLAKGHNVALVLKDLG
ncbi:CCD81 protein, partial [Baryphthengus martii]|nr:CCD81 protein [Baryphthengus martii]